MTTLAQLVLSDSIRPRLVDDCTQLVDDQVKAKKGVSGLAIRTAYQAVSKIRPGFIRGVVDALLDEFVEQIEPFYAQWRVEAPSSSFGAWLPARADDVAHALLRVTDARAERTPHAVIRKIYPRLRPMAHPHVAQAIEPLGRLVDRYLAEAGA